MESRLLNQHLIGFGPVENTDAVKFDQEALGKMPLCERIAYERAVKKGLNELTASNPEMTVSYIISLYN